MKTFNDFREETSQVSELSIGARKAQARRLKVIGSKASTKFKKAKNKLKAMTQDVALKKGMKKARNVIMQKVAGKGKDLSDTLKEWLVLDSKEDVPDSSKISFLTWKESTQELLDRIIK